MFNSSFKYKRLAGGHIRFGEDIVSEAGSASGGISSHDGCKNDTQYGTLDHINCKAYNYHKVAGDNF